MDNGENTYSTNGKLLNKSINYNTLGVSDAVVIGGSRDLRHNKSQRTLDKIGKNVVISNSNDTNFRVTSDRKISDSVHLEPSVHPTCCQSVKCQSVEINSKTKKEFLHIINAPGVSNEDILWGYQYSQWEKCPRNLSDSAPVPVVCSSCCLDRIATLVESAPGHEKVEELMIRKANNLRKEVT